jgi:hypothetical protein
VDDEHIRLRMFDLDPEKAECLHCPHAIVAREESAQDANTIRERSDNRGAVRDALIARHRYFRLDAGCPFNAKFHMIRLSSSAQVIVLSPGWAARVTISIGTFSELVQCRGAAALTMGGHANAP